MKELKNGDKIIIKNNINEKISDILIGHYAPPKEFDTVEELAEFEMKQIKKIILKEIEQIGKDTKDTSKEKEYERQEEDRCIWNTAIENVLENIRILLKGNYEKEKNKK